MKLYKTILIFSLFLLSSCSNNKIHYIKIENINSDNSCIIFPQYNLSMKKIKKIPARVLEYFNKCDLVIFDNDYYILSKESVSVLYKPEIVRYNDPQLSLSKVISQKTYSKLDSLLQNEKIPTRVLDDLQPWVIANKILPKYIFKEEAVYTNKLFQLIEENIHFKDVEYINKLEWRLNYYSNLTFEKQEQMLINTINIYNDPRILLELILLLDTGQYNKVNDFIDETNNKDFISKNFLNEIYIPLSKELFNKIDENMKQDKEIIVIANPYSIFGDNGIIRKFQNNEENYRISYH